MKNENGRFTCSKAKKLDMVEYLSELGYMPKKIRGVNYWYLSPFRSERTPSFKIDRRLNLWYDHGEGKGGNLVDFAIQYHNCTVGAFLENLNGPSFFQHRQWTSNLNERHEPESRIKITAVLPLKSLHLIRYLQSRGIPLLMAEPYLKEVHFELAERSNFSIGFLNDRGGYELRNICAKNSSSPKSITCINNASKLVAVFEGFFDFLSFLFLHQNTGASGWNFCILNSLSFFELSRTFLEEHEQIHLYLDNDQAGQKCSSYAQILSAKYQDESNLYRGYKDLNEWHTSFGKGLKNAHNHQL